MMPILRSSNTISFYFNELLKGTLRLLMDSLI